jgi:hypothetical protein
MYQHSNVNESKQDRPEWVERGSSASAGAVSLSPIASVMVAKVIPTIRTLTFVTRPWENANDGNKSFGFN